MHRTLGIDAAKGNFFLRFPRVRFWWFQSLFEMEKRHEGRIDLFGIQRMDGFRNTQSELVGEAQEKTDYRERRPRWTEVIPVWGEGFLKAGQEELGVKKAMWREQGQADLVSYDSQRMLMRLFLTPKMII